MAGALLPENAVGGGAVPDGDYIIKSAVAQMFNYGGKGPDVPAITFLFVSKADPAIQYEQSYAAGKNSELHESADGKRFKTISKNSNAFQILASLVNSGFPKDRVDDDVTVFVGTTVTVVNTAQPKRPGMADQVEGKTIPLVTKILALPGTKAATTTSTSKPAAASTNHKNGEGELTPKCVELIQSILGEATDNTMSRVKLSTQVMLKATKDADLKTHMAALKKLAGDATWLIDNAEAGGWAVNGEDIVLGGAA